LEILRFDTASVVIRLSVLTKKSPRVERNHL